MTTYNQTVFIIDDDPIVCDSLRHVFESADFTVETYFNAQTFFEHHHKQESIILDILVPRVGDIDLDYVNSQKKQFPIIVMRSYADVPRAIKAMQLGESDFIVKPFNQQIFLESMQKKNEKLIEQEDLDQIGKRIRSLTDREQQILNLIVEGKLNKEIAYDLNISMSTVEAHRSNMVRKMKAKNFVHLIKIYLKYQFESIKSFE